jgi:hypothetical protein
MRCGALGYFAYRDFWIMWDIGCSDILIMWDTVVENVAR